MAKETWIQTRVTEEVKEKLKEAAQNDGRTLSNYVLFAAIEKMQQEQDKKE